MKKEIRTSHNVGLVTAIEGRVQKYKGKLIIPLSYFGESWDMIPKGGRNKQGGLVFKNSKIAVDLYLALEKYLKVNQVTVRDELYGWFYSKCREIKLSIWYFFYMKRKIK